MKKSYSAFNLLFLRRNKSAWMEDYTTLSSYFYLKSFSFHQNSDSQTNLFEYMSNHQSSSNTPSQLSLLCKTFKSPELQQAEVNLIMITSRHLPYLDSVSLNFSFSIGHPKEDDYNLISIVQQITEHFEVSYSSQWDHFLENHAGLSVNKQSEEHNLQTVSGSTACKKNLGAQWRFATLFCTEEVLIFLEIVRTIWIFMDSKNQGLDSYSIEQMSEIKVLFLSLLHDEMNHDRDYECRSLVEIYRFR